MAITAEQLAEVRDWVGSTPDDGEVGDTFDALGSVRDTIRRILRRRRADLIANPAQFSVPGEYSQNTGDNLKYLDALIASLDVADISTDSESPPSAVKHFERYGDDCFTGR
jgi:hypothetical protein